MADVLVQSPARVSSDNGSSPQQRPSSLASRASNESNKARTSPNSKRENPRPSSTGDLGDSSPVVSFPSLSVKVSGEPSSILSNIRKPSRTTSQRFRDRKATLAGLTSASPQAGRQSALFDDSPRPSSDIPGALHLASDDHIERMIIKHGATKLLRQYAADLAHRDAEISSLRIRSDVRERELKRLLREVNVPSADIEKRLLRLERPEFVVHQADGDASTKRNSITSIDGLVSQAISDDIQVKVSKDISATAKLAGSPSESLATTTLRRISSNAEASKLSRSSSQAEDLPTIKGQEDDGTTQQRIASPNPGPLAGLQNLFQPPSQSSSYFIGGNNKNNQKIKKTKAADELSVKSTNSGKSPSAWSRLFGGAAAAPNRSRASSLDQGAKTSSADSDSLSLSKTRTNPGGPRTSVAISSQRSRPTGNKASAGSRIASSPNHARKDSNASSLPPTVELDSMIESSQLPPTMTNHNSDGLLTDRFGFIYDRRRKRGQLASQSNAKQKLSSVAAVSLKSGITSSDVDSERPSTPTYLDEDGSKKSWQEYLTPASNTRPDRPRELLSHTPSAGAVVTVNAFEAAGEITPPRVREASIAVSLHKALPVGGQTAEPQSSTVNAMSTVFSNDAEIDMDLAASKILLDQLTELHDALQTERTVKWNDFLRRVRAERASVSERGTNNAPEADLVHGELVGIATLGRSNKTKGKYMHFKSLVLSGIPVSLRPKIWAECSGATQMRIPGYYEDLVARCEESNEIDPETANQITADVKRTLRDNVFFRSPTGPGAQRLEELLRAYSLHNPTIGYCQGMNLITGSLLLICVTPEDCFWLLVAIIDHILPSGYFDQSLLVTRADQAVLRHYVTEVLPKLDAKLEELGVELEACTFHWFLSLYSGVLTGGEALYRVWDVVLCLNSSDAVPDAWTTQGRSLNVDVSALTGGLAAPSTPTVPSTPTQPTGGDVEQSLNSHDGTGSPFLFQLGLALLKLNEPAILALESPAQVYTYLNHNMTAHNITIDALVAASEGLRTRVRRQDVLERRKAAVKSLL